MLRRALPVLLAVVALLTTESASQASHTFQQSGGINYLYRNLEVPTGIGKVFYSLCGNPYGVPSEWRVGVENWDNAFGNWQFDELACGGSFNTKLIWENALDGFCPNDTWDACWIPPGIGGYVTHGSHRDVNTNRGLILFDFAQYSGQPNDSWRIFTSAHEWGHNMGLADHAGDDICDHPTTPSIMDTDPDSLCPQSPTTADINSVRCNVYHLCAGVRVAAGDIDADGCEEIITAPGPGPDPWVRVWDALVGPCITSTSGIFVRAQFLAYAEGFEGGVYLSAGNIDTSTAADEIITGAGAGGGPHVRVLRLSGTSAVEVAGFMAYETTFTGGVRVGAGNMDSDTADEVLTAPGSGYAPRVRTWNYPVALVGEFDAYSGYNAGVFVAGGNLSTGSPADEIVTGTDQGGAPLARGFANASGLPLSPAGGFWAYDPAFLGGVRVGAGNVSQASTDTAHEIITGAGPGGGPHVRVWKTAGTEVLGFMAYDPAFTGGVFVAGGNVNGGSAWEVITGADAGGSPHVRVFQCCLTLTEIVGFFAY